MAIYKKKKVSKAKAVPKKRVVKARRKRVKTNGKAARIKRSYK